MGRTRKCRVVIARNGYPDLASAKIWPNSQGVQGKDDIFVLWGGPLEWEMGRL